MGNTSWLAAVASKEPYRIVSYRGSQPVC